MKETFIRKYWDEEDILYYLHFQDKDAIRQIEVKGDRTDFFSIEHPEEAVFIYDQSLDDLDWEPADFITKEEFEKAWNNR